MSIDNLIEDVNGIVNIYIKHGMQETNAVKLGLDPRAGYTLYVNDEAVACPKYSAGTFDYYGGAEYVDRDHRVTLGDYVFYLRDSSRVNDWIECYYSEEEV